MSGDIQNGVILLTALLLQLGGLVAAIGADTYMQKRNKKLLLTICAVLFSLIVQNLAESYFDMNDLAGLRTAAAAYGYAVRPAVMILLLQIISSDKRIKYLWAAEGVNALLYLTSFITGLGFRIGKDNVYMSGPLHFVCFVFSFFLLALNAAAAIRRYRGEECLGMAIPLGIVGVIVAAIAVDSSLDSAPYISFVTVTAVSGTLFYYIWLHLRFVREHEKALNEEARIQIMMSQIQPHFLFNALSNIKALCRKDPETAAEMITKFSTYLRQNLESLDQPGLIPFSKELEHTKIYTDIEKMRFDYIGIEYDTDNTDFCIPALTVQPMAENAIKHGLFRRGRGVVRISTGKEDGFNIITISDNGEGFDTSVIDTLDNKHIGIRNVRERIEKMCGGVVEITSRFGEGTTVVIKVPVR